MTQSYDERPTYGRLLPDVHRLTDGGPTSLSLLVELLTPEWGEMAIDVLWEATLDGLFTIAIDDNNLTLTPRKETDAAPQKPNNAATD